ncbi:MAG: potassium/proton antiporter [Anaerolineae bacterium]|nr:potassium/proton antiporter [Anaerolineae bacterium]
MITIEQIFVTAAAFLLLSIVASKVAVKSGVPALLLFLLLGMLAGSDGIGGIYFDNPLLSQAIGVVALVFILFSGGLDTAWGDVRPVLRPALLLSTIGVTITALAVGAFAAIVLGFSWTEGILLGAIIASTDAAAVFSVLRGKSVRLKGQLKPLLELESGSNDPMAVFLTIGMTQLVVNPEQPITSLILLFILQMSIGLALGIVFGRVGATLVNRLRLEYEGLYPVLMIALVLLTYGATALLGGSGFLAVYIAGLILGQRDLLHKRSLTRFHDGLAWLMQIVMFLALGLQVFPSRLPSVIGMGLLVALFLIVVARPVSVFAALAFSRFQLREKVYISWVGLRGAAPIVLATFPLIAGVGKADTIFHLVFFIVLTSVLVQGTLIIPMAKWLGVYSTDAEPPKSPLAFVTDDGEIADDLVELEVAPGAYAVGKQILDLHLPKDALIVLIRRGGDMIIPRGDTLIQPADRILLLASDQARPAARQALEGGGEAVSV